VESQESLAQEGRLSIHREAFLYPSVKQGTFEKLSDIFCKRTTTANKHFYFLEKKKN